MNLPFSDLFKYFDTMDLALHFPWSQISEGFLRLFYLVNPSEYFFEDVSQVPNFISSATPYFLSLMVIEMLVGIAKFRKNVYRYSTALSSLTAGLLQQLTAIFVLANIEQISYIYVYEHFRWTTLPYDSLWTWWLCFLAVDFGYYWFHRMAHEVNLFWATHVVHHSSEDYNLTTALRQSILQAYVSWMFYLPAALCIPPSTFLVHKQFNVLYQYWIHTEVVENCGVLEWFLNTPSHHRVHHGRNRYCIDKNYGGTLIIWDRIFGTFEAEKEGVVYGITHPLTLWNPIAIQFHHLWHVVEKVFHADGLCNKMKSMFYGPGWHPGTPRLGLLDEIPDVHRPCPNIEGVRHPFLHAYIFIHFVFLIVIYQFMVMPENGLPLELSWTMALYFLASLTSFGYFMENNILAAYMEVGRLLLYLILDAYFYWVSAPGKFVFLWYQNNDDSLQEWAFSFLYVYRAVAAISVAVGVQFYRNHSTFGHFYQISQKSLKPSK